MKFLIYLTVFYLFSGCNILFQREKDTHSLRVFNNSTSMKLQNIESESCEAKETYYVTEKITQLWKQLQSSVPAFYIRHENRKPGKHAHFLEVCKRILFFFPAGEQGWRSDESTHLPPMWPGLDSRTRRHKWVEFVVGSRPCSERFLSGFSGSPLT